VHHRVKKGEPQPVIFLGEFGKLGQLEDDEPGILGLLQGGLHIWGPHLGIPGKEKGQAVVPGKHLAGGAQDPAQGQGMAVAAEKGHLEAGGLGVKVRRHLIRGGQEFLQPGQGDDLGVGYRQGGNLPRLQMKFRRQDHRPDLLFPDLIRSLITHPEISRDALTFPYLSIEGQPDQGMGLHLLDESSQSRLWGLSQGGPRSQGAQGGIGGKQKHRMTQVGQIPGGLQGRKRIAPDQHLVTYRNFHGGQWLSPAELGGGHEDQVLGLDVAETGVRVVQGFLEIHFGDKFRVLMKMFYEEFPNGPGAAIG
jgi:hypothetical protein